MVVLLQPHVNVTVIALPPSRTRRLVFWLINMGFGFLERFADVLLSRLPRYYEFKLVALIWLMFYEGAESLYRIMRKRLKLGRYFGRG